MKIRVIAHIAGISFLLIALLMLIPALLATTTVISSVYITSSLGMTILSILTICLHNPKQGINLNAKEVLLLTNIIWIGTGLIASIPIKFAENISYTDAIFEAVSGITTTGVSILKDLNVVSTSTILWRSILQYIGGIGFIVLAIAVLPVLKVGGMRLFKSEFSDKSDKVLPRSRSIAKRIISVYLIASISVVLLFKLEGTTWFDAINYGITSISTGGFAPHNDSMTFYNNPIIHWTCIFFMIIGSLPFILMWHVLTAEFKTFISDSQVKNFLLFLLSVWVIMGTWLWITSNISFFSAFTLAAFNTTSVISTTGLTLGNYNNWGSFALCSIFFLSFLGGCSGSTSGGFKFFRIQICYRLLSIELKKQSHPNAIFLHHYNGQIISDDIIRSLIAFSFFYLLTFAVLSLIITHTNVDFTTALGSVIGCLSNSGISIGEVTGPDHSFFTFTPIAKWLLIFAMLIGRLEIITMLVLLSPSFWKQ